MFEKLKNKFGQRPHIYIALSDQALVSGANFITGVLLARYLGLSSYGVFAMAYIAVLFFGSLQQAIIVSPLQSITARKHGVSRERFFDSIFYHQLFFCLLAMLLTYEFCLLSQLFFNQTELSFLKFILPFVVFTYLMNEYFRKLFFARDRFKTALILDIISYASQIAGLIITAYWGELDLARALIIVALSNSISSTYGILQMQDIRFNAKKVMKDFYECWNYSKWLMGTSVLQWVSGNFFIISAGGILGAASVGAIRMAQNIIGIMHILFLALENFIPVNAAKIYHSNGIKDLYQYLKKMTIVTGAATFFVLVLLAVFSDQVIQLLYGQEFVTYNKMLWGFALLYVFVFTGMPLRFAIRTVEKNRAIFISYLISAIFSLLLAAPMISKFGVAGVFAGLILSQIILQVWYVWSLKNEFRLIWK